MDLDHVALGLHDVNPVVATLVGDLGATVLHGGLNLGFRVVQLKVGPTADRHTKGDGMTVELIEPWAVDRFDFLARFLERNGEGPHHLTFKVDDIRAHLARMEEAGYHPTSTNLDNPWWREAFFHPKQTFGTVIQIAQVDFEPPELAEAHEAGEGEFGFRRWWDEPPPRSEPVAVLRRVVVGVPDPAEAAEFYEGLLDGERVDQDDDGIEVAWASGRVRLERRAGRPPGVDRLECEWDGPPGERVVGGATVRLLSDAGGS